MPKYNYICNRCLAAAERVKGAPLADEEKLEVVFETAHAMDPGPRELAEARECPRCLGQDTTKTFIGVELTCYVRGYGYLDRAGCTRDMNLHTLKTDDPYAQYRAPGEVDHLEAKLKRGGRHDPKPKHYLSGGAGPAQLEQAVRTAVTAGDHA